MSKALSREAQVHAEWLGMLQPEGLVVSILVLEEAGLFVRQPLTVQEALREATPDGEFKKLDDLVFGVLGWPSQYLSRDVEAVFLFPWAAAYDQLQLYMVLEGVLFILILAAGLIYAWRKGSLEWV